MSQYHCFRNADLSERIVNQLRLRLRTPQHIARPLAPGRHGLLGAVGHRVDALVRGVAQRNRASKRRLRQAHHADLHVPVHQVALDLREGDALDAEAFKTLVRAAVAYNLGKR